MNMSLFAPSRRALGAFAAVALLSVSACSQDEPSEQASAEPTDDTLATAISDADDLSVVASALGDSGLAQVFDGAGSYTIFAPNDAAFEALGETGAALREPGQRAAMAAVLRDHIVPGYLTPTDIEAAIEAQGGRVKVETMGDHSLTFSRADGGVRVTSEDGSAAMLTGDALKARNGVAIALDGVLKKVDAPAA
jgi:uncharacterized surface protein with fasciclin (FAS1) repeats